MNKRSIVCEGLKEQIKLVSSLVFSLFFLPRRVDLSVCPCTVQQAMLQFVSESKDCYFLFNDSFSV